jgi:hypothetical protein
MFPKSRLSYYLGQPWGIDLWGYYAAEYNLDAYEIDLQGPEMSSRGEIRDYRFVKGISGNRGIFTLFAEIGLVTDRKVHFRGGPPDFKIGDALFFRTGLYF